MYWLRSLSLFFPFRSLLFYYFSCGKNKKSIKHLSFQRGVGKNTVVLLSVYYNPIESIFCVAFVAPCLFRRVTNAIHFL